MRRHKYNAVRTWEQGHWFASKREAARYQELLLLEKAGEITDIELQPRFPLCTLAPGNGRQSDVFNGPSEVQVAVYVADFRYVDRQARDIVVEDVKGVRTAVYRLKKRFVEAQYGITISEV